MLAHASAGVAISAARRRSIRAIALTIARRVVSSTVRTRALYGEPVIGQAERHHREQLRGRGLLGGLGSERRHPLVDDVRQTA